METVQSGGLVVSPRVPRSGHVSVISTRSGQVMFLSCCCPSGRKESKKRKTSSGGQSSCPSSPHYQPHYQPHSPIFTIQSQPANIQSDSLSSEDFYYYQVTLPTTPSAVSVRAIVIHHPVRMSTSSPKTLWCVTGPSTRRSASTPGPAT